MASSVNDVLLYKLLVIGDTGVGKSCMIVRYVDETFRATFITTIGIDYKLKTLEVDGKRVRLQIWDTAGQERFHTLVSTYYRGAVGILLVYDITEEKSFDNIRKWLGDIETHASSDVEKILVGNKCDLESERIVPYERGKQLAEGQNIGFIETSAKTNHNIDEAFHMLVKEVVKKNIPRHQDSFIELQQQTNVKKCSCW